MYLKDPKTKEPSVSLTFVVLAFAICIITIGLHLFKFVDTTSGALELFYSCCGLYFGRRWTNGKVTLEPEEKGK